jgi:DNA-binding transcriptional LysR family regulator
MELRHLRYFVAVAEHLHFGHAAGQLQIAQPSLSHQIRQLETELGVGLLERTKRNVRLTEAGRQFFEEARQILAHADQAALVARRASLGQVGKLRVGFAYWMDVAIIGKMINRFAELHPGIHVELRNFSVPLQVAALREQRLDVGFVRPPLGEPSLRTRIVLTEPFVVAMPHDHRLARRPRIALSVLKKESFILFARETVPRFYDLAVRLCRDAGFVPYVRTEADQPQMLLGLVAAGAGVSLVPASAGNLHLPGVVFLPLRSSAPILETALAWRRDGETPLIDRFIRIAQEVATASRARQV